MILRIMKNMEPAQYYGSMFGQDVEPAGTYVIEKDTDRAVKEPWVSGLAVIKNPITIEVDDDTQISYKYELAKEYKAKGKQLTKKLMGLGYDAIITMKDGETNEIILFPNCDFMLNSLNENKFLIKTLLRENLLENEYTGWHKPPNKTNGHPMYDISNYYDDDLYGPNGARYYGHGGSSISMDNQAINILKTAKAIPEQPIKIYRAIPNSIENPTINVGDWVTISLQHAKNHGYQQYDNDYIILSKVVKAKDLYTDGGSIHEWGYDPS